MRMYVPELRLGVISQAATTFVEQLGGTPWGLPEVRWPYCRVCRGAMTFLAQLAHHADRLDLGADERVLYLFQCNHDPGGCATWEGGSGANACFVVDAAKRNQARTGAPIGVAVETEVHIVGWRAEEDDASEPYEGTKLGGLPFWIQGDDEGPPLPWRYAFQMDSTHRFAAPAPSADELGCTVTRKRADKHVHDEPRRKKAGAPPWVAVADDGTYRCDAANFGDAGIAYIYVKTEAAPEGWMFWQCS